MYEGATKPTWYGDKQVWSVTGVIAGVRSRISDISLLWVEGELSEFRLPPSGKRYSMVFFTLKDPKNGFMISCTIPRARFDALRLNLSDGDLVQMCVRPDIYMNRGTFQLRVESIEHAGRGLIMQQLEALRSKLQTEGLFDAERKKKLPFLPRRVGVITGADTAALGDFKRIIYERYPPTKLVLVETLVQGDRAAPQIVAALRKIVKVPDIDVIVVTRGGGAFEDFLPFSDERVCRAIAECSIPIVSAIGHEKDSPISDEVADMRAATPTAAAKMVVPDYDELIASLNRAQSSMRRRGNEHIASRTEKIINLYARLTDRSPARFVRERIRWINSLEVRGRKTIEARLQRSSELLKRDVKQLRKSAGKIVVLRRERSLALHARLRALSPESVLQRGYAIIRNNQGKVVNKPEVVSTGDKISVDIAQGKIIAEVESVKVTGK